VLDLLSKYYMKMLLDFSTTVGREDISNQTTGNESCRATGKDNGVRAVSFTISEFLIVKSASSHNATFINTRGAHHMGRHNQTGHVLTYTRRNSNILAFRG
jgi:hypothetical protein